MRIVLDAMGSDSAPGVDVEGGVRAARRFGQEVILVGRESEIKAELDKHNTQGLNLEIVHADEVIEMNEHPAQAVRSKPNSSMVVGMKLLKDGQADAFASAGNSGGVLASSLASAGRIGRIKGVQRPALATILPTGPSTMGFMLDIGANTDCKPQWLAQFAIMGSIYAEKVLGIANPRVGLMANGSEEGKGNLQVQAAHELIKQLNLNFIGNVEGTDLAKGSTDVIVTDGFVGNVAVKTAEGVASLLLSVIRREIKARPVAVLGGLLAKPAFGRVARTVDPFEVGGGPLLGVNGVVIVAHGRSNARAIKNAIGQARKAVQGGVVEAIRTGLANQEE